MKLLVDNINSTTGWAGSDGATIIGTNTFPQYRAGNTSASLITRFVGVGSNIEKTYDVDTTDYDDFILWIWSREKGKKTYRTVEDYDYIIEIADGTVYYLPVYDEFYYIRINIKNIDAIDKIKITALHNDTDYLILNYALVCKDTFPYDILDGMKDQIEYLRDLHTSYHNLGEISGAAGDSEIVFTSSVDYLDRYSLIYIDDGVNNEIHQAERVEGNTYKLGKLYDGETLLNDYVDADVYLYYPIEFGTTQKEILLPSITLWGFASGQELISTDLDHIIDSVHYDGTFEERQVGQYLSWEILIDCETKEEFQILGELSALVRRFIGQKKAWINGRPCFIEQTAPATELYPSEAWDIMPKIQYPVSVIIREELYEPDELPEFTDLNIDVEIMED